MDLLSIIKEQSKKLSDTASYAGIENVISHIEIAEKHLLSGKLGNDYLFNDVIYRTNQAFEGSLKEAYKVLGEHDLGKQPIYKIEEYFETHNVLKTRVLHLLTNYRKEWRNESTHNYQIFFSEQEALLAIVSISAFLSILLDQMINKTAQQREISYLENKNIQLPDKYEDLDLISQLSKLILAFSQEDHEMYHEKDRRLLFESEISGMLAGYIKTRDPSLEVYQEVQISGARGKPRFIDFLFKKNNKEVYLELKRAPSTNVENLVTVGKKQLQSYMDETNVQDGIVYISSVPFIQEMQIHNLNIPRKARNIMLIYPKNTE